MFTRGRKHKGNRSRAAAVSIARAGNSGKTDSEIVDCRDLPPVYARSLPAGLKTNPDLLVPKSTISRPHEATIQRIMSVEKFRTLSTIGSDSRRWSKGRNVIKSVDVALGAYAAIAPQAENIGEKIDALTVIVQACDSYSARKKKSKRKSAVSSLRAEAETERDVLTAARDKLYNVEQANRRHLELLDLEETVISSELNGPMLDRIRADVAQALAVFSPTLHADDALARILRAQGGDRDARQEIFVRAQGEIRAEAAEMMRRGANLADVLRYLATTRRRVAEAQGDSNAELFGKERKPDASETEVFNRIMNMSDEPLPVRLEGAAAWGGGRTAMDKHDGTEVYPGEKARVVEKMAELEHSPDETNFRSQTDRSGKAYQVLGPGGIPLTGTKIQNDGKSEYFHTHPSHIEALMIQAQVLHVRLMKATSIDEKVELLGRITWLITNAMPYFRGSAAISEWYNQAVDLKENLNLGQRRGKLDLQAFRRTQDEYAKSYRKVWAGTRDKKNEHNESGSVYRFFAALWSRLF